MGKLKLDANLVKVKAESATGASNWLLISSETLASEALTSVVNGKIYAIGGASGRFVSLSTVEEYDPYDSSD